jgi:hypothetical protein
LFLNYPRNEDDAKYLLLNYRRNEDEAKYFFPNYQRNEDEAKYLFLNYLSSSTVDDLPLLPVPTAVLHAIQFHLKLQEILINLPGK